jgi:hypothetical protein
MSNAIAKAALAWVGREYNPGVREQCMAFVRRCLADAKHPSAEKITSSPVDGHWTGRDLASSLAGRDMGIVITGLASLQAGDVIFFDDTYETGFPAGTITHVAIALSPTEFVHRPTAARPVERAPFAGYWGSKFRCGIRLTGASTAKVVAAKQSLEIVAHSGKLRARWGNEPWRDLDSLKIVGDYS